MYSLSFGHGALSHKLVDQQGLYITWGGQCFSEIASVEDPERDSRIITYATGFSKATCSKAMRPVLDFTSELGRLFSFKYALCIIHKERQDWVPNVTESLQWSKKST